MSQRENKDYESNLEWKSWTQYISSTTERLDKICDLGVQCYFDVTKLNEYYATVRHFMLTRKGYIEDYDKQVKKLNKIGLILFKSDYMKDLQLDPKNPKLKAIQFDMMQQINEVVESITDSLVHNQILPKVTKTEKTLGAVRTG